MANNATDDPLGYSIIVAVTPLTGFQNGETFSVSQNADRNEVVMGNNGLGAFQKTYDRSGSITFNFLSTSDDNDVFTTLFLADELNPGGFAFSGGILQRNGRLVVEWTAGKIQKIPDISVSNGIDVRSWVVVTPGLTTFLGGTVETTTGDLAAAQALIDAGQQVVAAA
jgi:hypothetical protein